MTVRWVQLGGSPHARAHAALAPLLVDITTLTPHPENPRNGDVDAITESIRINGVYRPLYCQASTLRILAGNHTYAGLMDLGAQQAPVIWLDVDDDAARRIMLADNRTADLGGYDDGLLAELLKSLDGTDVGLLGTGYNDDYLKQLLAAAGGGPGGDDRPSLADRFLVPPFSVLDARSGWWRDRKRDWLNIGLVSEIGRGSHLAYKAVSSIPGYYEQKAATEQQLGRQVTHEEFEREYLDLSGRGADVAGTSVFDPVLCELVYRWFCPSGGRILDPWAGGCVRGMVAAICGLDYTGIELRTEQIEANQVQATEVLGTTPWPEWLPGDCLDVLPTVAPADLVFGCPPYYDLEQYGDDPRDLSNMTVDDFQRSYRQMIQLATDRLRDDRYAVLVVGSARDRNGVLRDLYGLTVDAAQSAGLGLLNEAVLVTPAGSLPIRAGRSFAATRVLGRSHQNVLVFLKGDRKKACLAMGDVDVADALNELADRQQG